MRGAGHIRAPSTSTIHPPPRPPRPNAHKSSNKPVVFFRDTNGWCPFCARVWLALEEKGVDYDCVLIDLYAKPEW
jgi:glutathione S-transferase